MDPLDHDSPWKCALELLFRPFLGLAFPDVAARIDWAIEPISLEQELRAISPDSEVGLKRADKLVKVRLLDGTDQWLLVHIEVQMRRDPDLPRRLFAYYYRILDHHGIRVVTLAILGDRSRTWRPTSYSNVFLGCGTTFHFLICKTIDFEDQLDDPRQRSNQALFVIAAHLGTQRYRKKPQSLYQCRLELSLKLNGEGYTSVEIQNLLWLMDWLMPLPEPLKIPFRNELQRRQPDKTMPHITLFQELGRQEGRQEGLTAGLTAGRQEGSLAQARESVIEALEIRFGEVSADLRERINALDNLRTLKAQLRRAITVPSLDQF